MTVLSRHASIADLLRLQDRTHRYELVRGELRQLPLSQRDNALPLATLTAHLGLHVWNRGLGVLYLPGTSFALRPDTVRAAASAFVATDRLAAVAGGDYFAYGAPDLAIDIIDAQCAEDEIAERVADWLAAGTRAAIVIDAIEREMIVYRAPDAGLRLTADDVLSGDDVVPGWEVPVHEIFAAY